MLQKSLAQKFGSKAVAGEILFGGKRIYHGHESLDSNPIFEIYETTHNFLRFSDFLCFLHFHFRRILPLVYRSVFVCQKMIY